MKVVTQKEKERPGKGPVLKQLVLGSVVSVAVLASGCASQSALDAETSAAAEPVEQAQVVQSAAPAPDSDAESNQKADPEPKVAQVEAPVQPASEPKQAAKEAAKTSEPAQPVVKAASAGETQADALMASLAKKDKFEVISEAPAEVAVKKVDSKVADAKPKTSSKPKAKPKKLVQKALEVSAADLPVTIDIWTLKRSTLPGDDSLVLTTPTWQMGGGDYLSQVWLTLRDGQLAVNSSSDIDPEVAGSGVKLNGGELKRFDRIEGNNVAILEGDWINDIASGGQLEIMMGFFPDKKKTSPLFKSDASLDALSRLVPTLNALAN